MLIIETTDKNYNKNKQKTKETTFTNGENKILKYHSEENRDYYISNDNEKVECQSIIEIKQKIIRNKKNLSTKQMLVAEYIINNIDTIPDIESAAELGKSLGVNVVVVKVTLSMLELGDFLTFKEIIKRSIKENSIIKSDDIKESSEDISIKNEEVDFDKLISNILGQDSISKEEEKFNISNIKNVLESKSINIEVDTSDELAIDSVFK